MSLTNLTPLKGVSVGLFMCVLLVRASHWVSTQQDGGLLASVPSAAELALNA